MLLRIGINRKGFTIIELMVVIAILGILATIAMSNFISHRNKAFCTAAEQDAQTVAAGVSEYFAMPSNQTVTANSLVNGDKTYVAASLSGGNTWSVETDNRGNITIIITDTSHRCPVDYRTAMTAMLNPTGYWSEHTYIKLLGR